MNNLAVCLWGSSFKVLLLLKINGVPKLKDWKSCSFDNRRFFAAGGEQEDWVYGNADASQPKEGGTHLMVIPGGGLKHHVAPGHGYQGYIHGFAVQQATAPHEEDDDTPLPTLDSVTAAKKTKTVSKPAPSQAAPTPVPAEKPAPESSDLAAAADVEIAPAEAQPLQLTAEELEEEADQEGAFNPETGEINWDCPCLGGMAHGPCGEEFRTAFSCFVYSKEEPKGIECVEKFKGMQDCFRLHPEIYGSELDEQEVDAQLEDHIASEATDATKEAFPEPPAAATATETEKKAAETTTSS
ncbi:hypothetical protein FQN50_007255 [Emmonsiellopsis sp. PD_5]|nr:hypothetical protein FQN50_007255 [Emmonsiellopsis sp. PD_5]